MNFVSRAASTLKFSKKTREKKWKKSNIFLTFKINKEKKYRYVEVMEGREIYKGNIYLPYKLALPTIRNTKKNPIHILKFKHIRHIRGILRCANNNFSFFEKFFFFLALSGKKSARIIFILQMFTSLCGNRW